MNVDANVRKILVALFKKWQLIVIIAVIGGMLGYFYTAKFTTLTYTSSVEFLAEADDPTDEIVSTGSSSSNECKNKQHKQNELCYKNAPDIY